VRSASGTKRTRLTRCPLGRTGLNADTGFKRAVVIPVPPENALWGSRLAEIAIAEIAMREAALREIGAEDDDIDAWTAACAKRYVERL